MKKRKGHLIWDKEKCYLAALQCTSKSEYQKRFRSAYRNASKNGWISEYTWFKTPQPKDPMKKIYVIYAYEDRNNKVAYIGLANDMENRHRGHKNGKKYHGVRRYDEIAKYCQSMGMELMKPKIKMVDLNGIDAQYYEDWYKKAYMKEGWKVLNIAPTGEGTSSLGGTYRKYSDADIIKAASMFNTPKEFMESNPKLYKAMYRRHLNKQIEWKKRSQKKFTEEQLFAEAKKYKSSGEFRKENPRLYKAMLRYNLKDKVEFNIA